MGVRLVPGASASSLCDLGESADAPAFSSRLDGPPVPRRVAGTDQRRPSDQDAQIPSRPPRLPRTPAPRMAKVEVEERDPEFGTRYGSSRLEEADLDKMQGDLAC